jgi:hypothetical protein
MCISIIVTIFNITEADKKKQSGEIQEFHNGLN